MPVMAVFAGFPVHAASGVRFTRTLGMAPNFNTFTVVGNLSAVTSGSLFLTDGINTLKINNLAVHEIESMESSEGNLTRVTVKDARWQLKTGAVFGRWNQQRSVHISGEQSVRKEKTLKELIDILFASLGVTANTAVLTGIAVYPPVEWEFDNPANEIDHLLEEFGFAVRLNFDDSFTVVRLGSTSQTIPAPFMMKRTTWTHTEKPTAYAVVGGRTVIEEPVDVSLPNGTNQCTPVGAEPHIAFSQAPGVDPNNPRGKIITVTPEPLKSLSYAPDPLAPYGGFELCHPDMWSVGTIGANGQLRAVGNMDDEEVEQVCADSVYRWYQIRRDRRYRYPMLPYLFTGRKDAQTGDLIRGGLQVAVKRTVFSEKECKEVTEVQRISAGYSFDFQNGIIKFDEPQYIRDDTNERFLPAEVYVTWAYESVYSGETDLFGSGPSQYGRVSPLDHYVYIDPSGASLAWAKVIRRPEMVQWRRVTAETGTGQNSSFTFEEQNLSDLDEISAGIIAQMRQQESQEIVTAQEGEKSGIVSVLCDGGLRSVTWSVSRDGAMTSVSFNNEKLSGGERTHARKRHDQRVLRAAKRMEHRIRANK